MQHTSKNQKSTDDITDVKNLYKIQEKKQALELNTSTTVTQPTPKIYTAKNENANLTFPHNHTQRLVDSFIYLKILIIWKIS